MPVSMKWALKGLCRGIVADEADGTPLAEGGYFLIPMETFPLLSDDLQRSFSAAKFDVKVAEFIAAGD